MQFVTSRNIFSPNNKFLKIALEAVFKGFYFDFDERRNVRNGHRRCTVHVSLIPDLITEHEKNELSTRFKKSYSRKILKKFLLQKNTSAT